MISRKLALVLVLVLGAGAIAGGIAYAQAQTPPPAQADNDVLVLNDLDDLDDQDPSTPFARSFSLFVDGGAFLGVATEDISKENMARYGMRDVRGVGVTEVVKDSPAEKAGLKKDDVILRFDGESVTSVRKLNRLVSEAAADQTVRLTISRGGAEQEVSATLSKRKFENVFGSINPKIMGGDINDDVIRVFPGENWPPSIKGGDGPFIFSFGGNRRIGVSTQSLTKQLADYFGVKDGGLLITSVNENSPAAKAGLKAGDVITAVDGEKVTSPGDVSRAINKKQDGEVSLTIVRDRNTRTVTLTPEKSSEAPMVRPGTMGTRRISIPSIRVRSIPEMNIRIPEIVIPATPPIEVTVPRKAPRAPKARGLII